jgi:calcium binding protein 39
MWANASTPSTTQAKGSPAAIVSALRKHLEALTAAAAETAAAVASASISSPGTIIKSEAEDRINLEIRNEVNAIKVIVYGEQDNSSNDAATRAPDTYALETVARALMAEEIMPLTIANLKSIDFETRKDFVALFNYMVRHDLMAFATSYLAHHSGLLYQIVDGYASTEIALNCGAMLRECVKVTELIRILLYGPVCFDI